MKAYRCENVAVRALVGIVVAFSSGSTVGSPVEKVMREVKSRFVQPNGTIVDFAGERGEVELPTPEECRLGKPNAVGWAVPISNGAFFTGDYLLAMLKLGDRDMSRKLYCGLCVLQDVSSRPGCIARGTGTDGKCHYMASSNDQVIPFMLGLEAYMDSPISTPEEKADCRRRLLVEARALEANGWKVPGETAAFDRGSFLDTPKKGAWFRWCEATHLLYTTGLLDRLERTKRRNDALNERLGDGKTRYDTLAECPGLKPHENWYSSHSVLITKRLAAATDDPKLAAAATKALERIAQTSIEAVGKWRLYKPGLTFSTNWRVQNAMWQPQYNDADADKVAMSGQRKLWHEVSPCIPDEGQHVMTPFAAAWNLALAGGDTTYARVRQELEAAAKTINFSRVHSAGMFFFVNAWAESAEK